MYVTMTICVFGLQCYGEVVVIYTHQYIKKQNERGGIFHFEFNTLVEIFDALSKVLESVLTMCSRWSLLNISCSKASVNMFVQLEDILVSIAVPLTY